MKHLIQIVEQKLRKASVDGKAVRIKTDNYIAMDSDIMIRLSLADLRDLIRKKEVSIEGHSEDKAKGKYASYTVRLTYGGKAVPKNVNL